MTVLVTGASGHLGVNLVRALLAEGRAVRALIHDGDVGLEELPIERVAGSTTDSEAMLKAVRGASVVYHLAGIISISGRDEPALTDVNVNGTKNVVAACLEAGVKRLVHFSSTHALEEFPRDRPMDEDRPLCQGPKALPYDRSKGSGELAVRAGVEAGLDAVVVNPGGVIGPHDYAPSRMGQVLLDLAHRRLPALVAGGYTWVDVRDVAAGAMAAEARGRTGERYILVSEFVSIEAIGAMCAQATGVPAPRMVTPMWLAQASAPFSAGWARLRGTEPKFTLASLHALQSNRRISNEKAKTELGFSPRPVEETIADTCQWFRETGRIPS